MSTKSKSKRIKPTTQIITTRAQAEQVVGDITDLQSAANQLLLERDHAVNSILAQYEDRLAGYTVSIEMRATQLETWATANRTIEFGAHKSLDFARGKIGFRTATPSVKPLGKKWTVDTILAEAKKFLAAYIRTKDELDKEKILADRNTLKTETLAACGLKIVQEETFYVEPNLTAVESRVIAEKAA